jgi:hypothetical protein
VLELIECLLSEGDIASNKKFKQYEIYIKHSKDCQVDRLQLRSSSMLSSDSTISPTILQKVTCYFHVLLNKQQNRKTVVAHDSATLLRAAPDSRLPLSSLRCVSTRHLFRRSDAIDLVRS